MFDTVDFLAHVVCLIKKIYKIYKTIYVHENIFNNDTNDIKRINNYLKFLIRRMVKHIFEKIKKLMVLNILKRREYKIGEKKVIK
jgi:hypothetical protein